MRHEPVWQGRAAHDPVRAGLSAMQIAIAKTAQGIPLFEQLFFRNLFACIAAFVSLRRKNLAAFGKRENRGLLVFRSAAGYAGMIALFYASGHAAQGDVAIINKMSPFVVTVLACLFLKEKFTAYQGVALGLAFGGALLVSNPTFQSHWFPVAVAFLSAVFSGLRSLSFSSRCSPPLRRGSPCFPSSKFPMPGSWHG